MFHLSKLMYASAGPVRAHVSITSPLVTAQRFRYNKSKQGSRYDDSDSDEEDESDLPGSKVVTGHLTSLRADAVLKAGLGIARNKVETLFYESKLRLNGQKLLKKSARVEIGDEVDVIKGPSPVNDSHLIVSRVVVLKTKPNEDQDGIIVKLRRFKSLTIENDTS